jgi:hypothetical protein
MTRPTDAAVGDEPAFVHQPARPVTPAVAPPSPTRPWLVDAAAAGLVLTGTALASSGVVATVFAALWAWIDLASGYPRSSVGALLLGVGLIAFGVVEWWLARRLIRGDRQVRAVAMVLSAGIAALAGLSAVAAADPLGTSLAVAILVVSALTVAALLATGQWFVGAVATQAREATGWVVPTAPASVTAAPAWDVSAPRRGFWPLVVVIGGLIALWLLSPILPQGDRGSLAYLRGFPEQDLAIPGASSHDRSESGASTGTFFQSPAKIEHRFATSADPGTIVEWYDGELLARGWVREDLSETDRENRRHVTPRWHKGFALLSLLIDERSGSGRDAIAYAVRLEETNIGVDLGPLARLRILPATALIYPGSTEREDPIEQGRLTTASTIREAVLVRRFQTSDSIGAVLAFYERTLRADGWTVDPTTNPGRRSWRTDDATLDIKAMRRDIDRPITEFDMKVAELLGPDALPGMPWEAAD